MVTRRPRLILTAAALVAAFATAPNAFGAPVFVLTGKGYGHGIGLSQYGTQGYAQHGWGYTAILEHYYKGAAVTPGHPNDSVDVLLASGRASVQIASTSAFEVTGQALPAGTYTVTPAAGQISFTDGGITTVVASPAEVTPGTAALALGGTLYRGRLTVATSGSGLTLSVLNTLGREAYIRGVVPREMPSSWEQEALRAQAVAARTYSLAGNGHCSWPPALLDGADGFLGMLTAPLSAGPVFCADTRDQVYGGRSAETAATDAAVQATGGEAVTYGGAIATTYFFSTSGGKTAAKADEWGGPPVPYLVSVPDPYDGISPHHAWGPSDGEVDCPGTSPDCVFTAARIRDALGLGALPTELLVTARNASSRVGVLEARTGGGSSTFTGTASRSLLGLRSTWFFVGALSLTSPTTTVTYGGSVAFTGLARSGGTSGWGTAYLERRRYGEAAWVRVGSPLPNGGWHRLVVPIIRTDYRVDSGNATTPARTILVRTRVRVSKPKPPYARLSGTIGPGRDGITVTLRRKRADSTWVIRARTQTTASGAFVFKLSQGGTYRASADAGAGLLGGYAVVTVPAG